MARRRLITVLLGPVIACGAARAAADPTPAGPPVAPVHVVTDHLWGRDVPDRYRWMESEPAPQFRDFLHAEDRYARSILHRIDGRDRLLADITAVSGLTATVGDVTPVGASVFFLRRDVGADLPKLYRRDANGRDTLLVDPGRWGQGAAHAAIDQFAPSADGRLVAVGISLGGSEQDTLHVFDADGRALPDRIDRATFASTSWLPDNRSFFYARLPVVAPGTPPAERWNHLRVFRHVLGTDPDRDPAVLDSDHLPFAFPAAQRYPAITVTPGSDRVVASVSDGVSPEIELFTAPLGLIGRPDTPWRLLARPADDVTDWAQRGDTVFLLSHKGAPRFAVLAADLGAAGSAGAAPGHADPGHPDPGHPDPGHPDPGHPDLFDAARTVPTRPDEVVTGLAASADALWVAGRVGATFRLARAPLSAVGGAVGALRDVPLPFAGTIEPPGDGAGGLVADPRDPGALVGLVSWVHAPTWYRAANAGGTLADTGIAPPFGRDLSPYTATETTITARDGTAVPVSIVTRRDAPHDGHRPTIVSAYGSYGISYDPYFAPNTLPWFDRGGVMVFAHVRGGGEKGADWHDAGKLATKENTITDSIDAANAMVARGLTDHAHLAGEGTSAGGITIGGAITQDPSLYRAALIRVGATDTLHDEFTENGPANIPEFGTVTDRAQFPFMLAIDAYQSVRDGVRYPAVLLTGGADDPRVTIWEPAKMAARLQAATASGRPVLFRVEFDAGHGFGSTRAQRDAETADEQSFLLWQMNEPGWSLRPATATEQR